MNYILQALLLLATAAFTWVTYRITKNGRKESNPSEFTAMETFVEQIESDNARLLEAMQVAQQRTSDRSRALEERFLVMEKSLHAFTTEQERLTGRILYLEHVLSRIGYIPDFTAEAPLLIEQFPPFLNDKYAAVAKRLLAGHKKTDIATEMQIGLGEVEMVEGLLREGGSGR